MRHREHTAGEGEEVAVLYLWEDGGVTQSVDAKRRGDTGDIDFNVPPFSAYVFNDSDDIAHIIVTCANHQGDIFYFQETSG